MAPKQGPKLELKTFPKHLAYVFMEENEQKPIIIVVDLELKENESLVEVLKIRKKAIAWKITDIK